MKNESYVEWIRDHSELAVELYLLKETYDSVVSGSVIGFRRKIALRGGTPLDVCIGLHLKEDESNDPQ